MISVDSAECSVEVSKMAYEMVSKMTSEILELGCFYPYEDSRFYRKNKPTLPFMNKKTTYRKYRGRILK